MESSINLLSSEFAPNKRIVKTSRLIKIGAIIGLVILGVAIVMMGSVFIYDNRQIVNSENKQDELKASIVSMAAEEQTYVLAKDRASKAKQVYESNNAFGDVDKIDSMFTGLPEGSYFGNINTKYNESEVEARIDNLSSMLQFFGYIANQNYYSNLKLFSFDYNPEVGYTLDMNFSN